MCFTCPPRRSTTVSLETNNFYLFRSLIVEKKANLCHHFLDYLVLRTVSKESPMALSSNRG